MARQRTTGGTLLGPQTDDTRPVPQAAPAAPSVRTIWLVGILVTVLTVIGTPTVIQSWSPSALLGRPRNRYAPLLTGPQARAA